MIPDQYPKHYKALELHSGYYDTFSFSQQYRNKKRLLYVESRYNQSEF